MSARTDTERLEWIVANWASFGSSGGLSESLELNADGTISNPRGAVWTSNIFARVPCTEFYEWHCYDGATWRDALDAAMDAPRCRAVKKRTGCINGRLDHGSDNPFRRHIEELEHALEAAGVTIAGSPK